MARVTVEDCIENIPNRFELVGLAARRAKQISSGSPITLDRDNDKDAVVSLREIAEKTIELEPLREEIVETYSRNQRPDVVEGLTPPVALPMARADEDAGENEFEVSEEMEEEFEEAGMIGEEPDDMAFDDDDIDADD